MVELTGKIMMCMDSVPNSASDSYSFFLIKYLVYKIETDIEIIASNRNINILNPMPILAKSIRTSLIPDDTRVAMANQRYLMLLIRRPTMKNRIAAQIHDAVI